MAYLAWFLDQTAGQVYCPEAHTLPDSNNVHVWAAYQKSWLHVKKVLFILHTSCKNQGHATTVLGRDAQLIVT